MTNINQRKQGDDMEVEEGLDRIVASWKKGEVEAHIVLCPQEAR